MHAKIIPQERVERHRLEGSIQSSRQTEEAINKMGLSQENRSHFVEMITPKKNNKTRNSTEYHIIKFIPCFEKMPAAVDIDDFSDEDDSEEEDEED
eukprot:8838012-Ditylum_brightwellii.AAC.1